MKKQIGLYLFHGQRKKIEELIPDRMRSRTIRNYLLNEYELPSGNRFANIFKNVTDLEIVNHYMFNDESFAKLDIFVKQANEIFLLEQLTNQKDIVKGKANRSSIMRDLLDQLINKYKDNPIPARKIKKNSFMVPVGTKERISKLIPKMERDITIEEFILEVYEGPKNLSDFRKRPTDTEKLNVGLDEEVFKKLDTLKENVNFEAETRSPFFRDAIEQMLEKLTTEMEVPVINVLEKHLGQTIEEMKRVASESQIKEAMTKYLKK